MVNFDLKSNIELVKASINKLVQSTDRPEDIIVVLLIFLSVIAIVMAAALMLRNRAAKIGRSKDGFDRIAGVLGKLEKIEKNLNDFKTEVSRSVEKLNNEIEILKGGSYVSAASAREEIPNYTINESLADEFSASDEQVESDSPKLATSTDKSSDIERAKGLEAQDLEEQKKKVLVEPLEKRLTKTRAGFFSRIRNLFSGRSNLDPEMFDELEALLVGSDLGVRTVQKLLDEVKQELSSGQPLRQESLVGILKIKILNILEDDAPLDPAISPRSPTSNCPLIVMMVGINGAGKTTTTAKLAAKWQEQGARVLMVAADTFRAAAVEQLIEWGKRLSIPVHSGEVEAKPSTVIFSALERAVEESFNVVIIDTAGRLHTRANLMQELEGIRNVAARFSPSAPHETLLVLDGSIGINAVNQAKEFHEAVPLSGLVVTKLDGTPKGGVVVAIKQEVGIPVRYIGVGEAAEDLRVFSARDFVEALFSTSDLVPVAETSANAEIRRRRRADGA